MARKQVESANGSSSKTTPRSSTPSAAPGASFGDVIQQFMEQVESLSNASDMTMKMMKEAVNKAVKCFTSFMGVKGVRILEKTGSQSYQIKPEDFASFKTYYRDMQSCLLSLRNVPRMFLCSLVHHYDAYLGRLLRTAFLVKPDLLSASKRQLSFAELTALSSITAAREYIIEKEVESVIRDGHADQFDWMESRFALSLRNELTAWPRFIEITERRNLFVHCDGVVSSQYLAVCAKHGVSLTDGIKTGDEIGVVKDYLRQAVECILEIGVKLGHVLWRKLQPDRLKEADRALHMAAYDVLAEERYTLAKVLLHFAVDTLKKQSSEDIRCMNMINLAIAHNFSGEREQALAILKTKDWSASEEKFKLAVAVLEHRYTDAMRMMHTIGARGSISRVSYSSWPLFKEFRKRKEFLAAYRDLFGEEFVLPKTELEGAYEHAEAKEPTKASNTARKVRGRASRARRSR